MRSVPKAPDLPALAAAQKAEADRLDAEIPALRTSARTVVLLTKAVVDRLLADVGASDVERVFFLRERFKVDPDTSVTGFSVPLADVANALRARELGLLELFSDRLLEFVDRTHEGVVSREARAKALRETAAALERLAAADFPSPAPEAQGGLVPADDGTVYGPGPNLPDPRVVFRGT